jgi:flagellar biosynthesis GTPase FlhF
MGFDQQTYRGESLEELLPQIRSELGADAVIVRQREGIIGGIGGFFGKKCIEIDAVQATPRPAALPVREIVDAYDTGDPAPPPLLDQNPLLEALLAQTSPFSTQLVEALEAQTAPEPAATPAPASTEVVVQRPRQDDRVAVLGELAAAGVPAEIAAEVVDEVDYALRPFEPDTSFRELARRSLARRIQVAHGWKTPRRTIAVLGLPGSGRTLAAARLCAAYAASGRSVGAISLESARASIRLAELTQGLDVEVTFADNRDLVAKAKRTLAECDVVVVDTPPIANRFDGAALRRTAGLVEAARAGETHLLLPVGADPVLARRHVNTVSRAVRLSRLLLTHEDRDDANGVAVGLSLATRTPVSFVASGDSPSTGLAPAEPDALARMVLA